MANVFASSTTPAQASRTGLDERSASCSQRGVPKTSAGPSSDGGGGLLQCSRVASCEVRRAVDSDRVAQGSEKRMRIERSARRGYIKSPHLQAWILARTGLCATVQFGFPEPDCSAPACSYPVFLAMGNCTYRARGRGGNCICEGATARIGEQMHGRLRADSISSPCQLRSVLVPSTSVPFGSSRRIER